MKVLLTGASSFTGFWFARELARAGCHVVAPLRGAVADYKEGVAGRTRRRLSSVAEVVEAAPFGSDRFMQLAEASGFDLLCHHAARVGEYRSPDFDIPGAVAENTANLRAVLEVMARRGLKGVVLTGSVFEQDEGAGEAPLVAFSPYGLSKGLTAAIVSHRCREFRLALQQIRHSESVRPAGGAALLRLSRSLLEEGRKSAREHAELRARQYPCHRCSRRRTPNSWPKRAPAQGRCKLNPSGYVETQGAFAERFAAAMRPRLGMECGLELAKQTDFSEPLMRVNVEFRGALCRRVG